MMKKIFLIIAILTIFIPSVLYAGSLNELYSTSLYSNANLEAYFRFEGNSNDTTGVYNGTDTNASYNSSYGKFGQGVSFSGNGYINLPNYDMEITNGYTIVAWIKTSKTGAIQAIFSNDIGLGSNRGWQFRINSDNTLGAIGFNSTNAYIANSTYVVTDGNWHHVAMVYGNSLVKAYIDGKMVSSSSAAATSNNPTSGTSYIGADLTSNQTIINKFTGYIDDVALFNTSLTDSDIEGLANGFGRNFGEYIGAGSGTTKLLVHFDGNSSDYSGNGNNGSDTNITYGLGYGRFGQGASFNGSSSYISIPNASFPWGANYITISLWFKYSGTSGAQSFLMVSPSSGNSGLWLYHDNTNLKFAKNQGTQDITYAYTRDTNWHNFIVTSSNSDGLKMYLDGRFVASDAADTAVIADPSQPVFAGAYNDGGSVNNFYYNGSMDELVVENRVWTQQEIKKYYSMTKGRFVTN